MEREEIRQCLEELNDELRAMNVKGEVCLYGGAVMCLVFDARPSTKDVDAVFKPTVEMRQAVKRVAEAHGLPDDWLNDAVKGYVVPHPQRVLFDFSNLKVFVPDADYLLAMKTLAARVDTTDLADVKLLIGTLGLQKPEEVFSILEKYYPRRQTQAGDAILHRRDVRAMITLRKVKEQIDADQKNWCVHLMDFVDDFRRHRDSRAVAESFALSDRKVDALLASTAEALCDEAGVEPPDWLARVPSCDEPYFVGGLENLKAISIVESPLRFRIRKIFVLENFPSRV